MARAYEVTAAVPAGEDGEEKNLLGYGGSQGEANDIKKAWLDKYKADGLKRSAVSIEQIEVPTDKSGLMGWLNKTFGAN